MFFIPHPPLSVGVGGREPADLPRGSKSENLESRAAPILRNYVVFFFIGIAIALKTGLEIGLKISWILN